MISNLTIDILKAIKNKDTIKIISNLAKNPSGLTYTMIGQSAGWKSTEEQKNQGLSYHIRKLLKAGIVIKQEVKIGPYKGFNVYMLSSIGHAVNDTLDMLEHEIVEKVKHNVGKIQCKNCNMEITYKKTQVNNKTKYCSKECQQAYYKSGNPRGWNLNKNV